jgi:DNA-binding MarR family transcriptional regulator
MQDDAVGRRERGRVQATEVSWALRELQRAQGELDRYLAGRLGLRALDYAAMTYVMQAPLPPGPGELAGVLGISTGSGTELADRLERAGHLHRRRAPGDRRRVVLEPDEDSVAQMIDALSPLLADLEEVAATFTDGERAAIARYLIAAAERTRLRATAPPIE